MKTPSIEDVKGVIDDYITLFENWQYKSDIFSTGLQQSFVTDKFFLDNSASI